jgi:hypothetical protein
LGDGIFRPHRALQGCRVDQGGSRSLIPGQAQREAPKPRKKAPGFRDEWA